MHSFFWGFGLVDLVVMVGLWYGVRMRRMKDGRMEMGKVIDILISLPTLANMYMSSDQAERA